MKEGNKVYCIRDYIEWNGDILNNINKYYLIVEFSHFHHNENDRIVKVHTNDYTINIFWLKYQEFNDGWDDMRKENLFSDYFISERKYKLQRINEISKH